MKYTLLLSALLLVLFSTSCSHSAKFSPMLNGGFDPEAAFRQHGYTIRSSARYESITKPESGSASKSWCGVITSAQEQSGCEAIAKVISGEHNKTMGNPFDQLGFGPGQRSKGQPLKGDLIYNQSGVHGEMHVWLMPDATNAAISYVIFLREERFK